MSIITLLTDFGTRDYFVGAMKGAILSVNPDAHVVDLTHEIPAHDVRAGAYTLLSACETFPAGTIHVAVVDPGVGSARRAILAECAGQLYVGPDNGLFSYVCERAGRARFTHLTNRNFFRSPVSDTFHGRDIFAPVAAALSNGVAPRDLGEQVEDPSRLPSLAPRVADDGTIEASIIHVDRFGNCVINLTRRDLTDELIARGAAFSVNGRVIRSFRRFFDDGGEDGGGELFAVWGSAGFLEIAAFQTSAAERLGARRGQIVTLTADV